ncbi:MAG: hypothetical protein ABI691_18690 [Ginsengibacter sp.]
MKKISVVLIIGIISSSIITNVNAQIFRGKNDARATDVAAESISHNTKSAARLRKAELKSFKVFNRDFKVDRYVKWSFDPKIFTATFTTNNISTNVVYNSKGTWLRTEKTYYENEMDSATRAIVKSKYFDDSITKVREIEEGETTCYFIYLENAATFKIVTVVNGGVNIYEQYTKQS